MKIPHVLVFGLTLLVSGCFLVPAPYADQLNPVAKRYSAVQKGSARADVVAQFGEPTRMENDGLCVWETRVDKVNYTLLKVRFDANSKAKDVEVTRAHGEIGPNSQTSAVWVRSK